MAVLEILLFQITALNIDFQHVMPDDLFKKLPKFGKIKSGTA